MRRTCTSARGRTSGGTPHGRRRPGEASPRAPAPKTRDGTSRRERGMRALAETRPSGLAQGLGVAAPGPHPFCPWRSAIYLSSPSHAIPPVAGPGLCCFRGPPTRRPPDGRAARGRSNRRSSRFAGRGSAWWLWLPSTTPGWLGIVLADKCAGGTHCGICANPTAWARGVDPVLRMAPPGPTRACRSWWRGRRNASKHKYFHALRR